MNKIFYNIDESHIVAKIRNFDFYFSSESLKNKFLREYERYIEEEKIKLDTRYKMNIDIDFFLLSLYKQIETRGFKVYHINKLIKEDFVYMNYDYIE